MALLLLCLATVAVAFPPGQLGTKTYQGKLIFHSVKHNNINLLHITSISISLNLHRAGRDHLPEDRRQGRPGEDERLQLFCETLIALTESVLMSIIS